MYRISNQEFSIKCIWKFVSFDKNPLLRGWKLLQFKWQLKWGTETKQQRSTNDIDTNGAQLVPPNFSHQVSFTRRQFSLARLFFWHDFFLAQLFFLARLFFWHDFFFRHDFFLARLFFGTTFFWHDFFSARLFFDTIFFLPRLFFFGTTFFLRHDFFLARLFFSARIFFGTIFFFSTTFFWLDFFFDTTFFSARLLVPTTTRTGDRWPMLF